MYINETEGTYYLHNFFLQFSLGVSSSPIQFNPIPWCCDAEQFIVQWRSLPIELVGLHWKPTQDDASRRHGGIAPALCGEGQGRNEAFIRGESGRPRLGHMAAPVEAAARSPQICSNEPASGGGEKGDLRVVIVSTEVSPPCSVSCSRTVRLSASHGRSLQAPC